MSAAIGPLTMPPTVSPSEPPKKRIRRVRRIMHGTVVGSSPDKHWRVHWDDLLGTGDHTSRQLTILAEGTLRPDTKKILESAPYLGKQEDLKKYTVDGVPPPPSSTSTTTQNNNDV